MRRVENATADARPGQGVLGACRGAGPTRRSAAPARLSRNPRVRSHRPKESETCDHGATHPNGLCGSGIRRPDTQQNPLNPRPPDLLLPKQGSCLSEVEPAEIVDDHRHSVETERPEHHGVMAAGDFSQFARCSAFDEWPLTSTKVVCSSYRDRYVCLHGIPPKDVTHSMRGSANRAVSPQRGVGGFEGVTIGDLVVWANSSSRPRTVDAARKWMRGVHRSACARRWELALDQPMTPDLNADHRLATYGTPFVADWPAGPRPFHGSGRRGD